MDSIGSQVGIINNDASSMSTEGLIMALLGQIQSLEEERDNARLLAAKMKEKLEFVSKHNNNTNGEDVQETNSANRKGNTICNGVNSRLAKLLRDMTSNTVNELEKIITNEEQRLYNLKQLQPSATRKAENPSDSQTFQSQLALYKGHYERLLAEAENDKLVLRKKLKEQQDLVLDRDIKIRELEIKLNGATRE